MRLEGDLSGIVDGSIISTFVMLVLHVHTAALVLHLIAQVIHHIEVDDGVLPTLGTRLWRHLLPLFFLNVRLLGHDLALFFNLSCSSIYLFAAAYVSHFGLASVLVHLY